MIGVLPTFNRPIPQFAYHLSDELNKFLSDLCVPVVNRKINSVTLNIVSIPVVSGVIPNSVSVVRRKELWSTYNVDFCKMIDIESDPDLFFESVKRAYEQISEDFIEVEGRKLFNDRIDLAKGVILQ